MDSGAFGYAVAASTNTIVSAGLAWRDGARSAQLVLVTGSSMSRSDGKPRSQIILNTGPRKRRMPRSFWTCCFGIIPLALALSAMPATGIELHGTTRSVLGAYGVSSNPNLPPKVRQFWLVGPDEGLWDEAVARSEDPDYRAAMEQVSDVQLGPTVCSQEPSQIADLVVTATGTAAASAELTEPSSAHASGSSHIRVDFSVSAPSWLVLTAALTANRIDATEGPSGEIRYEANLARVSICQGETCLYEVELVDATDDDDDETQLIEMNFNLEPGRYRVSVSALSDVSVTTDAAASNSASFSASFCVPEPSAALAEAAALAALGLLRHRRRRRPLLCRVRE